MTEKRLIWRTDKIKAGWRLFSVEESLDAKFGGVRKRPERRKEKYNPFEGRVMEDRRRQLRRVRDRIQALKDKGK